MLIGWIFFKTASRVPFNMLCSLAVPGPARVASRRSLPPTENPLERKEERPAVFELRDQPRPVRLEERGKTAGRQMSIVLGQERPLHPFDDLVARGELVWIHGQMDPVVREPAMVQQACVFLGAQAGLRPAPA